MRHLFYGFFLLACTFHLHAKEIKLMDFTFIDNYDEFYEKHKRLPHFSCSNNTGTNLICRISRLKSKSYDRVEFKFLPDWSYGVHKKKDKFKDFIKKNGKRFLKAEIRLPKGYPIYTWAKSLKRNIGRKAKVKILKKGKEDLYYRYQIKETVGDLVIDMQAVSKRGGVDNKDAKTNIIRVYSKLSRELTVLENSI